MQIGALTMDNQQLHERGIEAGLDVCCLFGVLSLWAIYLFGCAVLALIAVVIAFTLPAVGVPILLMLVAPFTMGANLVVRPMTSAFQQMAVAAA